MNNRYTLTINNEQKSVVLLEKKNNKIVFKLDETIHEVFIESELPEARLQTNKPQQSTGPSPKKAANTNQKQVIAPMPGVIITIDCKEGDKVKTGQKLLVMEAMKMENNISATIDGKIKKIHVAADSEVENNQLLIELED